jgi:hypothetical protein
MDFNEDILASVVFPKIAEGKTILLLGAGASITDEKKYLSSDIIESYSRYRSLDYGITDIVEFVNTLSADPKLSRRDFDDFVLQMLEKLRPTKTHETIVEIPWREIITTNIDLLIEHAYDAIRGTARRNLELRVVRDVKEEQYSQALDEMRYVKLNGCSSSRDKYSFVFSSKDFDRVKSFYRKVLTKMRSLSPQIEFISVGYSYSDPFAKYFLDRFDEFARAGRRRVFSVDPFVSAGRIPFFEEQNISIIPYGAQKFFEMYREWLDARSEEDSKRRGTRYYDINGARARVPAYLLRKLGDVVRPLDLNDPGQYVNPTDYYCGKEPTLDVIRQNLDVENKSLEESALTLLKEVARNDLAPVPILLVVGEFGIGKSTFLYRMIAEALKIEELYGIAFEILSPDKVSVSALNELFQKTGAKTILLLVENIESDSSYREFRQLHGRISIEQFSDFKVILLSSIRENILERFRRNNALPDTSLITTDRKWKKTEILELLRKLEELNLIENIDARTREEKADQIIDEFDGDLFVSLVSVIKNSDHQAILQNAIGQLTAHGQKTLVFTSLLNQHKISMPLGLIRSLIGVEWDQVSESVLKVDFKGLVTTREINEPGLEPDTYLQIRHRRIAELVINITFSSEDRLLQAYKELISRLDPTNYNAVILVDLLKAIRQKEELSQSKINALFDHASQQFHLEPHFVIHYSMNLERRGTANDLLKAIDEIRHLTSALNELQNDRLVHRRAVATSLLAKLTHSDESVSSFIFQSYVNDAETWFERKRTLDPLSHYSYYNYLDFEIWCNRFLSDTDDLKLQRRVKIAELFEQAESLVGWS